MQKLIFFDTETTGNTDKDFLCQLAYKSGNETFEALYKPEIKIPPEASAIHHITNKMIADKPVFKDSSDYKKIKELFEDENVVVVAHNAPFDLIMLEKENIKPKNFICTLRVIRHLDKEEAMAKYNLQYLRYLLEIEVEATAHDALGDVLILEKFFEYLKKRIMQEVSPVGEQPRENISESDAIERMLEISSHPSLLHTFKFGKYNGKRIEDVERVDRGYLQWLLDQKLNGDGIDEDWIYTLKYYLNK